MGERKAYFDEFGERRYAPEMIDWLAGKPQAIWMDVVPHLNWDSAESVLLWMAQQEQCDLAVAAWIFWGTGIESVVKGGYLAKWHSSDAGKIADTVRHNVQRGFYRSSKLRFPEPYRSDLERSVERWRAIPERLKREHPDLDLPAPLLGPFKGWTPFVWPHWRAQHNPYVWDLFMGLGTSIEERPGWSNLYNIYLLSDWRLVLGPSAALTLLMIAVDQLMKL
jgi:Domain of unknown function (DUF4274)